jgi:predicted DNA-binding transcriptional regulator YafY
MTSLEGLTHAVQERLEFIERQLIFKGWVSRADLIDRFSVGEAAATRDFKTYREISGNNMSLNHTVKRYEINLDEFSPCFVKSSTLYINELKNNFFENKTKTKIIEPMERISYLKMDAFSYLSRAITNSLPVKIKYRSIENDLTERVVVPHCFFDTDVRMYVRCYDRKRLKFSDFMVNRVVSVSGISREENKVFEYEKPDKDNEWNEFIELKLIPHPKKFSEKSRICIEMDLDMVDGNKLVSVRKSLAAYWLNRWDVDCSKNGCLKSKKYQLYLSNNSILDNVNNNFLAPGYDCID